MSEPFQPEPNRFSAYPSRGKVFKLVLFLYDFKLASLKCTYLIVPFLPLKCDNLTSDSLFTRQTTECQQELLL